jgi:hypothetical protein
MPVDHSVQYNSDYTNSVFKNILKHALSPSGGSPERPVKKILIEANVPSVGVRESLKFHNMLMLAAHMRSRKRRPYKRLPYKRLRYKKYRRY